MRMHRFGKRLPLPSTRALKHQLRMMGAELKVGVVGYCPPTKFDETQARRLIIEAYSYYASIPQSGHHCSIASNQCRGPQDRVRGSDQTRMANSRHSMRESCGPPAISC